jgi:hypothetical protein
MEDAKMVRKHKQPTAGQAFAALLKNKPELLRGWNETKDKRLYTAKGIGFNVRQLLRRQANRWREDVGTDPPDLTSLEELEALASAVGIPYGEWEKFTAGELIAIALERFGAARPTSYGPNLERDAWLYEQRQQHNKTWDKVHAEFRSCRAERGWQAVALNGIREAVMRFAAFHDLPLRKGRAGRPKRAK